MCREQDLPVFVPAPTMAEQGKLPVLALPVTIYTTKQVKQ